MYNILQVKIFYKSKVKLFSGLADKSFAEKLFYKAVFLSKTKARLRLVYR